jgi:NTP pyrophosphatase (non-canonical NTP hydrolase)
MGVGQKEIEVAQSAKDRFDGYAAFSPKDFDQLGDGTLARLQVELAAWQNRNFGAVPMWQPALGAGEEVGELQHAVLKHFQGIRGLDDKDRLLAQASDAIGDVVVYLMQVCTALRLDFETVVRGTATHVMKRDWVADKATGGQNAISPPAA